MKKLFLMMGGAIFLSTTAFAYRDMDERLDSLESKMTEISSRNPEGTLGASFRSSRPETENTRFFGTFDLLYWHPKLGGTEFAFTADYTEIVAAGDTIIFPRPPKGDLKENDLGWDFGLRFGLGYKTPYNDWDVTARYTWYSLHDSSSHQKTYPSNLFSLRSIIIVPCDRVKSHVGIDLNNLEIELARSFFLSKNISVRPHLDVKSSWIDLDQKIHYSITSAQIVDPAFTDREVKVTEWCRFWGMGPRIGVDSSLYIGDGVSLIGELAGSILYSYFKTSMKQNFPIVDPEDNTPELFYKINHKFHRFIPFVQMFLGLKWHTYLNNHRQFLQLKAGYEAQYYWRVNQMMANGGIATDQAVIIQNGVQTAVTGARVAFEEISEDLAFYGITGEVRLDF